ncbi:unnamed protein product [Chondrus crispus]|uniref:RRM domain-containing protein n=1 Tax=Chondrus crispus TaxID=2769 RepID=R7QTQ0_CHOCR|nr:unnamed protein product [Chondrus crispus]CDF40886.1 unnamed protein product [Chondrus crispus]|eukprot:XP_005711180.1 unnamed protein product [Chondrus crispus]
MSSPALRLPPQRASPPPDAPPRDQARLFIGNLPPRATDAALTRLLSKFGAAGGVSRHPTRAFAHASLRDDAALQRCVAALNRTTWCGGVITVQRAREHFWHRLSREWEQGADGEPTSPEEGQGSPAQPFENTGKGKHTVFSFPDIDDDDNTLLADAGVHVHAPRPDEQSCSDNQGSTPGPPPRLAAPGPVPKSATLDSTLQLFGLVEAPLTEGNPVAAQGETARAREEGTHCERPAKRARSKPNEQELQRAEEAAHQPALIDLDGEKETALSVLKGLFGKEVKSLEERIKANRRLGLFRKLDIKPTRQPKSIQGGGKGRNVRASSKRRGDRPLSSATVKDSGMNPSVYLNLRVHRRAGLYRKLATVPSDKDPDIADDAAQS